MQRAQAEQLFALKVTICAQISRCRSKLRCVGGCVCCCAGTTRALKSNSSTPTSIAVIFFVKQDILIFHLTQNQSLTFPRRCCFWEALRSISHDEQLACYVATKSLLRRITKIVNTNIKICSLLFIFDVVLMKHHQLLLEIFCK